MRRFAPWKAVIAAIALVACGHPAQYPLTKLTISSDQPDLAAMYAEKEIPLLIIGQSVYEPPCDCLEKPCGRMFGGVAETRNSGGTAESRQQGGGTEKRQVGGRSEDRQLGGGAENRQLGGGTEARQGGGDTEARTGGDDAEARAGGAASESRRFGADDEGRRMGGATATLKCVRNGTRRFRVTTSTSVPIQVFDARGLRNVEGSVVDY